jgi:hypothetical protein
MVFEPGKQLLCGGRGGGGSKFRPLEVKKVDVVFKGGGGRAKKLPFPRLQLLQPPHQSIYEHSLSMDCLDWRCKKGKKHWPDMCCKSLYTEA